ncbi:MAG: hypothetical protein NTY11_02920 [Candidatus Parcubacteria bacterium]|nr:hypothetical protein [Candidatus Parcubacteria bacterium]
MTVRIQKISRNSFKMNFKIIWGLSIFSIIGLFAIWVLQMQSLSRNSILVSEVQNKLAGLPTANAEEAVLVSAKEMPEIDKVAQDLNFERIDKVHYIRAAGRTALAK